MGNARPMAASDSRKSRRVIVLIRFCASFGEAFARLAEVTCARIAGARFVNPVSTVRARVAGVPLTWRGGFAMVGTEGTKVVLRMSSGTLGTEGGCRGIGTHLRSSHALEQKLQSELNEPWIVELAVYKPKARVISCLSSGIEAASSVGRSKLHAIKRV